MGWTSSMKVFPERFNKTTKLIFTNSQGCNGGKEIVCVICVKVQLKLNGQRTACELLNRMIIDAMEVATNLVHLDRQP